jgi:hypothetical protein
MLVRRQLGFAFKTHTSRFRSYNPPIEHGCDATSAFAHRRLSFDNTYTARAGPDFQIISVEARRCGSHRFFIGRRVDNGRIDESPIISNSVHAIDSHGTGLNQATLMLVHRESSGWRGVGQTMLTLRPAKATGSDR